jgi:hypothetical protein
MRRFQLWILVGVALVVLVGAVLLALPPIVRRVAVNQLRASTGREVTIDRVRLNLFTRRITIDGLRIPDPGAPPLLEFARLEAHFRFWPLLRGRVHIDSAELTDPMLRIVRVAPDRLNASDVVARMTSGGKRPLNVTLDRFALANGSIAIEDRTTSPPGRWEAAGLTVDLRDIRTVADADQGRATMRFTLAGAPVTFDAEGIGLHPLQGKAQLTVGGADLAQLWAYVPSRTTVRPAGGRLAAQLAFALSPEVGVRTSGDATITDLAVLRSGQREPIVTTPAIRVTARDVDLKNGEVDAARVEIAGEPTIVDATTSPPQRFELKGLHLTVTRARYPSTTPAAVMLRSDLPAGGRLDAHGSARLDTLATHLDVALGGLDLALVRPYLSPASRITVDRGTADATIAVDSRDGRTFRLTGDFAVKQLVLLRAGQSEPFVTHPVLTGHVTNLFVTPGALSLERLVMSGPPTIIDATASPPARYDFRQLSLVARDVRWPGPHPAHVDVKAAVDGSGSMAITGTIDPATLTTDASATISGLDLQRLAPYLPPAAAVKIAGGRLDGRIRLRHDRSAGARIGGELSASDLALARPGEAAPFMTDHRLRVSVPLVVVKDGRIQPATVRIDGAPTLIDTSVAPPRRLALRGLRLSAGGVSWPLGDTASIDADAELPEAGTLQARGTIGLAKRTAALIVNLRNAALGPLRRFLPINAPLAGSANASLDLTLGFAPSLTATARGAAEVAKLAVGGPDDPPVVIQRVQAEGIDVEWPSRVHVDRLAIRRPVLVIARDKDGRFPLRTMLLPPPAPTSPGNDSSGAEPPAPRPPLTIAIGTVEIERGDARFVDHTTSPFYSEELGHLAIRATNVSNAPDSRAELHVQGVVGGRAALELTGWVSPFGSLELDVSGKLRDFAVPRTNPYAMRFLDWIARSGALTTRVHYRVSGGELQATNQILVQQLSVERARDGDRVQSAIGLPLGLVVALLKDAHGAINLSVPVTGRIDSPQFSFGDAILDALRNIIVRVATAPFRLIGRVFQRDGAVEGVEIHPVDFEPGGASLTPATQRQLQRVADFMRASPYVKLVLRPVVSGPDLVALKTAAVVAAIQRVSRERMVDYVSAAKQLFQDRMPDRPVPDSTDEIVKILREREPTPEAAAHALESRRVEVMRQALVESAGIQRTRLEPGSPADKLGAEGQGRIEFEVAS